MPGDRRERSRSLRSLLKGEVASDPETLETQPLFDEAFDDIIVVATLPQVDDDWMAGEFDIT